jgi:GT2 family glycosyltransferase
MVALPDVDVSIIIVSFNGRDLLRECLSSIYSSVTETNFEVIVVDNASEDGTPEMVIAEFPKTTLIRRSSNAGFAYAVNEGVAVSRCPYILLLNPDTRLTNDPLPSMIGYLEEHQDIAVLAPKLLDSDGSLQLSCRAFPQYSTALFNRNSLLTRFFGRNRFSQHYLMTGFKHDVISDVDWASAACWLLPKLAMEKIGPLDEGYFWTIEDVDFCQRVHRAGMRVVYYPDVEITHHIGGSSKSAATRAITERHRGMWRYYKAYLRPEGTAKRVAMDLVVWMGIQSRRGWKLLFRSVS